MSQRKARRAWQAAFKKHNKPGAILLLEIRHDDNCLIYKVGVCNCNPDRTLRDENNKVLATVIGAGDFDPLEMIPVGDQSRD